jgi:hypothetical protein
MRRSKVWWVLFGMALVYAVMSGRIQSVFFLLLRVA